MARPHAEFDIVSFLDAWESGRCSPDEEAAGFQHLIDSGIVNELQGSYGRRAAQLVEEGACHNVRELVDLED